MKFKKVLLVLPSYPDSHYSGRKPRLRAGMGFISEVLTKAGIDNSVFDMELNYNVSDLFKKIESYKPDLIGIRMMSFKYKYNYSIIEKIKKKYPHIKIIVGGPHVSLLRENVLKGCKYIDYGAVLEGEELILELCRGRKITEIKGLIHRNNRNVVYNGDRVFIQDLDKIPFPTFSKFEIDKYPKTIDIATSRGCPYECIFCPVRLAIGRVFRWRTAKNIVDEIEYWYKKGYRYFEFVDDNFTLIQKRVFEFCDEIEKRGLKDLKLSCGNGVRADRVTREMLKRMREVGFYLLAFGVESGSEKVLKNLKKGERLEQIETAIKYAVDLGFRVELFFLIGSKGETYKDVLRSFKLAMKYPVTRANFYNIVPFPNTEIYDWLKSENGLLKDWEEYLDSASAWVSEPIYEIPTMSHDKRIKALKMSKKIRRKVEEKYFSRFLNSKGLPAPFSNMISVLYAHDEFKLIIARMGMVQKLKEIMKF